MVKALTWSLENALIALAESPLIWSVPICVRSCVSSPVTFAEVKAATKAYADLAKANNLSVAQMALAFVNQQRFVGSNIIGATTMDQLRENIDSAKVVLSDAVNQGIADIHKRYTIPAP